MFISYGRQQIDDDDIQAVLETLKSDRITQGERVSEFERALAMYCGAKFAVCVSSGTAALHLANRAIGVDAGDIVVTTPFSFVATSNSILYCNGTPAFVDIDPDFFQISLDQLERFLKTHDQVKAIMPVHYAGFSCDMKPIRELADTYNCRVIEDASHALGAHYEQKKVGSCQFSDMTVFSFHPVKSITTAEGGAILTNDPALFQKLCELRHHALKPLSEVGACDISDLGYNYRLSDIHAALGISQLKKLDGFIEKRKSLAKYYLAQLAGEANLSLFPNRNDTWDTSSWHLFPIRINLANTESKKAEIMSALMSKGIGVQVHYMPIHLHNYYKKKFGYKQGDFPVAENVHSEILTLPLHVALTQAQVDYVCDTLRDVLKVSGVR